MKNMFKIIGLSIIAAYSAVASAVPTLYFDGDINYGVSGGVGTVSVDAALVNSVDIAPIPNYIGSTMNFSAILNSVFTDTTPDPDITYGIFGTNTNVADDLTIYDGDNNLLLTADFTDLYIFGAHDSNNGNVYGFITATGGSLMSYFGDGDVIAMQLNLSTTYSSTMFDSDWGGQIDGRVVGEFANVSEPNVNAILLIGLLMIGFSQIISRNNNKAKESLF